MPPQLHFEGVPQKKPQETREDGAVNDPEFGGADTAPVTLESLYAMRRAHEKQLELAYRDPAIDQDAIARINGEIAKLDGDDASYQAYLKEVYGSE